MSRSTLPGPFELRLTDGRRAQLRTMLEQQREFRLDQLAQLHMPWPHGPLSSTDPEIFRSLVAGAREALREVQSALWRMDVGRYGRCVACDDPVEIERLEILPQTSLCMACQRGASG
jgi:DnaK suppressor protein